MVNSKLVSLLISPHRKMVQWFVLCTVNMSIELLEFFFGIPKSDRRGIFLFHFDHIPLAPPPMVTGRAPLMIFLALIPEIMVLSQPTT